MRVFCMESGEASSNMYICVRLETTCARPAIIRIILRKYIEIYCFRSRPGTQISGTAWWHDVGRRWDGGGRCGYMCRQRGDDKVTRARLWKRRDLFGVLFYFWRAGIGGFFAAAAGNNRTRTLACHVAGDGDGISSQI